MNEQQTTTASRLKAGSLFTPVIILEVDGGLDVALDDSFLYSYDEGGEVVEDDVRACELLDFILGDGSTPDRLRRLADYIEAQGGG